jgi:hypothetical protein
VHYYRRRLPHRDAPGVPAFITWRLHGSLPRERIFDAEHLTSGEAFVAFDRLLDAAGIGPVHLRRPELAAIVQKQLFDISAGGHCSLHAYAVMPNHAHLLCTPQIRLADLMRYIKGATALLVNERLGSKG